MRKRNQDLAYYVYLLSDPVSMLPFYVGQTNSLKSRLSRHSNEPGLSTKIQIIRSIQKAGKMPAMTVLEKASFETIDDLEKRWIRLFLRRGVRLANIEHNKGGIMPCIKDFGIHVLSSSDRELKFEGFRKLLRDKTDGHKDEVAALKKQLRTKINRINELSPGEIQDTEIRTRPCSIGNRARDDLLAMKKAGLEVSKIANVMEMDIEEVLYVLSKFEN